MLVCILLPSSSSLSNCRQSPHEHESLLFHSIRVLFGWENVDAGLPTVSRARLRLGNGPVSSEARQARKSPAVPSSELPCVRVLGRV